MAQITKQITVDVSKKNRFQAIVAKQNDSNSRFLQVRFANEGELIPIEGSSIVTINAKRADKDSKSFAGEVNNDGTVTVPLTNWMLELDDVIECDISIIDSEMRKLTSTSFTIEVEAAANLESNISNDENYDILITLLGECANIKRECEQAIENANSAAEEARAAVGNINIPGAIAADDTIWHEIDLSQYTLVMGTINSSNGGDTDSNTTRCKMRAPLFVYEGTKIKFHNDDSSRGITVHIYDLASNRQGYEWTEYATGFSEYTIDRDCLIRLVFLNGTEDITEDTYGEMISSVTILSPKPPLQQIEGEPMPYFRKEIRNVSQRVGREDGFKMSAFTDIHCYYPALGYPTHLGYSHFRNIEGVANNTHLDAVVNLGDITMGYSYGSITHDVHRMVSEWSKSLPSPYLQVVGNHDENYCYAFGGDNGRPDEILTPQETASYHYHPNDIHRRSYYYQDFPEHKTRIIVLNSNDAYVLDEDGNPKYNKEEVNGGVEATYAFMPQQVEWLAELLHKTEQECKGWDIVICSHQSVCPTGSGSTQVPKNTEVVWGLLTAFNSGGSYSKSISDGDFTVSVNEAYSGDCQIACTVYGHKHYDRAFKEDGIWNICVACSMCRNYTPSDSGATSPERTPYTVSEDAWDIFCITPEKIKTIRFGAGSDREFDR